MNMFRSPKTACCTPIASWVCAPRLDRAQGASVLRRQAQRGGTSCITSMFTASWPRWGYSCWRWAL